MGIREYTIITEKIRMNEIDRMPWWTRAEHMEMNVPMKELWGYPEATMRSEGFTAKLKRLFHRVTTDQGMRKPEKLDTLTA